MIKSIKMPLLKKIAKTIFDLRNDDTDTKDEARLKLVNKK